MNLFKAQEPEDWDENPRVCVGRCDAFMCWNCGALNFHDKLWCIGCFHDGDFRMRLRRSDLVLAAATDVPGAANVIEVFESGGGGRSGTTNCPSSRLYSSGGDQENGKEESGYWGDPGDETPV